MNQQFQIDRLYVGLCFADLAIAKAARLSEVAQLAKIEARLREYLLAKWNARAREAAELSGKMAERGKSSAAIARAIDRVMSRWAGDIEKVFRKELAEVYELSRVAAWKKASGQTKAPLVFDTPNFTDERVEKARRRIVRFFPSFDATDAAAISAIQDQQMLWIGDHYGANVSNTIRGVSRESMLEAGRDRRAAGKLMRRRVRENLGRVKTPKGFNGSTIQYMEGLAANATTVARNYGNVRSFQHLGVTTYKINNPRDSRTCPVCAHLDGKVFTTRSGVEQMTAELGAESPDDIKNLHPWKPIKDIKAISPKPGQQSPKDSASLADAGFALPPYHFRCRCTIDVSSDPIGFDDLGMPIEAKPKGLPPITPTKPKADRIAKQWEKFDDELSDFKPHKAAQIAKRLEGNTAWEHFVATTDDRLLFRNITSREQMLKTLTKEEIREVSERAANSLIQTWNMTSADSSPTAVAMQLAAKGEFGLRGAPVKHFTKRIYGSFGDDLNMAKKVAQDFTQKGKMPGLKAFLRAQYDETQEVLKKKGIKSVYLTRGAAFDDKNIPKGVAALPAEKTTATSVALQPMNSYASNGEVGIMFAEGSDVATMFGAEVPAERIIGNWATGYGVKGETEWVVLGGVDDWSAFKWNTSTRSPYKAPGGAEKSWVRMFTGEGEALGSK